MVITVIGAGYVGLVTAACFAEMGHDVICVDADKAKVDALKAGRVPIHEPGLEALIGYNATEGRLSFSTSIMDAAARSGVYFIAVSTPPAADGAADITHVLDVAREIGASITDYAVVVSKSTVPVGTAEKIRETVRGELARRGAAVDFDVVSNPEFLKEGTAVQDFMRPDRIVIGSDSSRAFTIMRHLYAPFTRNHDRTLAMGLRDAELTKYAANAMLATRISFMNELADLCEALEVDVERVRKGIGADPRIGYAFLYPGCGYGGSCLPKDVSALVSIGENTGNDLAILKAVRERNALQPRRLFDKIAARFGSGLADRRFALWGLAFKPDTDDMREAPSLRLITLLLDAGAHVRAFDPVAVENARRALGAAGADLARVTFCPGQYDAIDHSDALVLVTEWKQFRNPDFQRIRARLLSPVIFDGRNQYDPKEMVALGFEYYAIGRQAKPR
jgi:UDPglucose 6-dehydrogenase